MIVSDALYAMYAMYAAMEKPCKRCHIPLIAMVRSNPAVTGVVFFENGTAGIDGHFDLHYGDQMAESRSVVMHVTLCSKFLRCVKISLAMFQLRTDHFAAPCI